MDNLNPPEVLQVNENPGDDLLAEIMQSLSDSGMSAVIYIIEIDGSANSMMDEEQRNAEQFQSVMGGVARENAILMDNPLQ